MNYKTISKITSGALLCTMLSYTTPIFAYTKDESVYCKLDNNGNSYNTIVSSHLINNSGENLINDISDLINIKNTNGNEKFTQDGNNLIWNSNGNDIYYQGESQKKLPIECKIRYELDGVEISPQNLAGKNGKIKIIIEYINKDAHVMNINGKDETLYTPFVAICGTIVNNEKNRNINVSNGKVIDDGTKTVIIGMALPGLKESLNISNLDVPNTVEITMDSTDFELSSLATFVTPKIIEDSDLSIFNELDDIYSKINTLQSSSKQLENGANTLKSGANTYFEKSKEFNSAINQVSNGVSSANQNYSKIDINTLNKNSSTLVDGAKKISEGTKAVSTNLNTISEGLGTLQEGTENLQAGQKQVSAGLNKIITGIGGVTATDNSEKIENLTKLIAGNKATLAGLNTVNTTLKAQYANMPETTPEEIAQKAAIGEQLKALGSAISVLELDINTLEETLSTLKSTDLTAINQLKNGLGELKVGVTALSSGCDELLEGQTALKKGADTLASKTSELAEGSETLYQGTITLANGTKTLNSGSTEMKKGLSTLNNGASDLTNANNQLTEGAGTISDGVTTLANGITKFNKEGMQTICNYINGDLKKVSIKLEKLQELSNEYNTFTMLNDSNKGSVKFILIMDGIKKDSNNKENVILNNKEDNN